MTSIELTHRLARAAEICGLGWPLILSHNQHIGPTQFRRAACRVLAKGGITQVKIAALLGLQNHSTIWHYIHNPSRPKQNEPWHQELLEAYTKIIRAQVYQRFDQEALLPSLEIATELAPCAKGEQKFNNYCRKKLPGFIHPVAGHFKTIQRGGQAQSYWVPPFERLSKRKAIG